MKSGMRFREMAIRYYSSKKESFQILGLPPTASKRDIKQKYYELAQRHHPDKTGLKSHEFLKIKNAFEILSKDQINRIIQTLSRPRY